MSFPFLFINVYLYIVDRLFDNHGRVLSYLRLAVTDRCNLRCFYCMPASGIQYLPKHGLLTFEEMHRLVRIMASMGIHKVRITGGEPFVRQELIPFLESLGTIPQLQQIHLTTNGVLTAPHIPALKKLGVHSVNLSLDSLDRDRFAHITRRDALSTVMETFHCLLAHHIPVNINTVVMDGKNIDDIPLLLALTKTHPVTVRFIEEMPFNGAGAHQPVLAWHHGRILDAIRAYYPGTYRLPDVPHGTAVHYGIPGHRGHFGIIAAFSRTFCGTCNRLRITAQGMLKTCLYDDGVLDLKALLRQDTDDNALRHALRQISQQRPKNGQEAELMRPTSTPIHASMSTIGG